MPRQLRLYIKHDEINIEGFSYVDWTGLVNTIVMKPWGALAHDACTSQGLEVHASCASYCLLFPLSFEEEMNANLVFTLEKQSTLLVASCFHLTNRVGIFSIRQSFSPWVHVIFPNDLPFCKTKGRFNDLINVQRLYTCVQKTPMKVRQAFP